MPPRPEAGYFEGYEREPLLDPTRPLRSNSQKRSSKKSGGWASGPDSQLSWLIAIANFLINFIIVGLGRMSGILYVVFMHKFSVDRQTSSMPFSVQQAARNLFGPAAGILGQKYGVLSVTAVGGLIGALSTGGCYFARDITSITVLWGLGFGICTALTTTLNQVPIDAYFEKYRTTAGGLAFSGGCVGAFLFPVVLEFLLHHHGVKGTFMVMGCIILIVVPISFTLRHPPWKKKPKVIKAKQNNYKTFDSPSPRSESEMIQDLIDKDLQKLRLSKATFTDGNLNNLNGSHPKVRQTSEGILNLSHGASKIFKSSEVSLAHCQPNSVNFAVLKQNSEVVYQLFSLTMPPEALVQDSILDTSPIVKELEDLYNFLNQPQKPKRPPASIGVVTDELTRSVHVVEVKNEVKFDLNQVSANKETPNYENFEDNPRWVFMVIKLRELCDFYSIEEVIHYFPVEMHDIVVKVMESLKDLNEIIVKLSVQAALAPTDKMPEWKDDMTRRQEKKSKEQNKDAKQSNSFWQHIMTAIRLHKNPVFILISLCRGVFMLTFLPMVTIIVDFAMDKGLPRDTGKYVIATLSLGDLVGRLCLGWITDSGILSLPAYMVVAMLILAVSTGTLPFMHSELSLYPAIMVFGMMQGSLFIRHQVLVSRYMDTHEQTIGMGFINFFSGILGFFIPFYLGYFRDTLGSYDKMFYLNGGICALVGLMWLFEPCLKKYTSAALYEKLQDV
ncbi:uncharacterized protein LOC129972164 [Argiope bruennichi]|uniref:Monocarboxylate transporter 12 like protein n=1 Tax=Argiope bruennichi TaxID=94029 RepID=A0A8T0FA49_ARGBR|nr:uncharacterized protein LOC129972164 [Argiope bruennichi]KAF8788124.1 Monocarboxylate transporter 12 like protein [Argiope bruennichi]